MAEPTVCTLIYEGNIMRFNNIALGFMTFLWEWVCVCLPSANWGNIIGHQLPNTIYHLPAYIELDFSEMTMKTIEWGRKRKEREDVSFLLH